MLDYLLENEKKFFKSLTDLECKKHDQLNDIAVLESKLIKFEISPERIDRIKNLVLLSQFISLKSRSSLKAVL